MAAAAARTLGFSPEVTLEGPLENVTGQVRHDLLGALQELLSNVSRHAHASQVGVECRAGQDPAAGPG